MVQMLLSIHILVSRVYLIKVSDEITCDNVKHNSKNVKFKIADFQAIVESS